MPTTAIRIGLATLLLSAGLLASPALATQTQKPGAGSDPALAIEAVSPLEPRAVLAAQAKLAFGLVGRLEQDPGENIVVSPASLAAVLALLELGADRRMRRALHRTLGFDRRAAPAAAAELDGLRTTIANLTTARSESGPFTLANAVVFDPAAVPYRLAVMGLRATGARVSVEDLSKPETLRRINEWVSAHTKGLIPSILKEPRRNGGLVALNALYFKDRWRTPFDPSATRPAPFRPVVEARTIEVPMMRHAPGKFLFRQDEHFVAIDLPYASDGFSMVFVTTRDQSARAGEFARVASWLTGDGFAELRGELALPRFSLSGSAELVGALDALGLRRARTSPTALRGLSPMPQTISRVVQKTELRVDEAGTEAAAATAVTTTRSLQTDYVKMVVDKPFVFALRDGKTGLILMSGYVGRPASAAAAAEAAR
jgi:serine protease inhibitor